MTRFAAEDAIDARLMDAAEIVFTTLSSTGRRAFAHTRRFDLVLIDEAAQASEMATLQPLTLATGRHVVPSLPLDFCFRRSAGRCCCMALTEGTFVDLRINPYGPISWYLLRCSAMNWPMSL